MGTTESKDYRTATGTRLVVQGAKPPMADCSLCGQPKNSQQKLSIAANGRLVHKACKENTDVRLQSAS